MHRPSGPLALLGSGEFEPWTDPVDRLLLEAADGDGSVALFPTASAPEGETYADWAEMGLRHYDRLGVRARLIEVRGREDADLADLARELERVSMIFFSGGNPAYLARVFEGSSVWAAAVRAIERGAAFVGCSAGACVAGAFAPDSMTEHIWEDRWHAGLRLLPDAWILPHFDGLPPDVRGYFLSKIPEEACALGIDERTAAVRIGSSWTVTGEGGAFVRRGHVAYKAGDGCTFDLDGSLTIQMRAADPEVVSVLDPIPASAGPVGLLSSAQFSPGSRELDVALLEAAGPRIGIVLAGDPSNAERVGAGALDHYRRLGAEPRVVRPEDGPAELDVLFLAGGDPSNLIADMTRSATWGMARRRWETGKAVAGSSAGAMALSEHCMLPEPGADLPTWWGRGLGPLRKVAFAVHASSRPDDWLQRATGTSPVDLLALDDDVGLLVWPGRPPELFGTGSIRVMQRDEGALLGARKTPPRRSRPSSGADPV